MSSNPGATAPLPEQLGKPLESSLNHIVENSKEYDSGERDELAPSEKRADAVHSHGPKSKSWVSKFFPSEETLDKLFSYEHMGNFVIDRQTGRKIFESMPLYVRVGMHLLFVDGNGYMTSPSIEKMLEDQSVKQGKIYDETGPSVKPHIESFIKTYQLPMDELLIQDLDAYPTFNAFFARRLLPTARPITAPKDNSIITSPADCRMTVFQTVEQAQKFWIKGKKFSIPALLFGTDVTTAPSDSPFAAVASSTCSLAIARLAPQDYHRFHSPVTGVVQEIHDLKGELYTVNPQAINEDLNVFTLNKRSVMRITADLGDGKKQDVVFVAVGAMLVGSIGWSKKTGDTVQKGEELGWFQYGGSTTICVFPEASGIQFDKDILANSEKSMETLVRVGMEIGSVGKSV